MSGKTGKTASEEALERPAATTVIINISAQQVTLHQNTTSSGSASSAATEQPKEDNPPTATAAATTTKQLKLRYYTVLSVPRSKHEELGHLLGVHRSDWASLEAKLPGGALFGSGCKVKGFDDKESAEEYYLTKHKGAKVPYHSQ